MAQEIPYSINITKIKENAHDKGFKGDNVVVAIVGSGINLNHEDLPSIYKCCKIDEHGNIISEDILDDIIDDTGRGTKVAGVIAMQDNSTGYLGVAPNVDLMIIKAAYDNSISSNAIASSIIWAVDNGADVINIPYIQTEISIDIEEACQYAYNKNVPIVVPLGDNEDSNINVWKTYNNVFVVGSVTENSFYNYYGKKISPVPDSIYTYNTIVYYHDSYILIQSESPSSIDEDTKYETPTSFIFTSPKNILFKYIPQQYVEWVLHKNIDDAFYSIYLDELTNIVYSNYDVIRRKDDTVFHSKNSIDDFYQHLIDNYGGYLSDYTDVTNQIVLADYSAGNDVDFVAPCNYNYPIYSNSSDYINGWGTAYSSAFLTGQIVLLKQRFPKISVEHIYQFILDNSVNIDGCKMFVLPNLSKVFRDYDFANQINEFKYSLSLINSGTKQVIAKLPEAKIVYNPDLKDIDKLQFTIPYYINTDIEIIENPNFDLINNDYNILFEKKINNNVIYRNLFVIKEITKVGDGTNEYKQVQCFSGEYKWTKYKIRSFKSTRKLYDFDNNFDNNDTKKGGILNYIIETKLYNTWTVDYVSPDLLNVYRTFDISEADLIQVIRECEKQFNCIFEFDNINRIISIKTIDEIGENKGLVISDNNLLTRISKKIDTNGIVTRLNIRGDNDLTISSIYPRTFIDDFTHYRNLKYMSQDLLDAFDDYDDMFESSLYNYQIKYVQLQEINQNIYYINNEIDEYKLQSKLIKQSVHNCWDVANNIESVGTSISFFDYKSILFDGTKFLMGTTDGAIINNAANFTRRASGSPYTINKIAYGNSKYVAVNQFGYVFNSDNGENWNVFRFSNPIRLNSICYGDGKFVAVGENIVRVSSNPTTTWSEISIPNTRFNDVVWDNSLRLFIAVTNDGKIMTSIDGSNWVQRYSGTENALLSVCSHNSKIIAVGFQGIILSSTNGIDWTIETSNTNEWLYGVCYASTFFVAIGTNGTILVSPNGSGWFQVESNTTINLFDVAYGNGKIIVVGANEKMISSTDGETWSDENIFSFDYRYWRERESFKQDEISFKELELNSYKSQRNSKQNELNAIIEDVKYENYFTPEQLAIIVDYINEEPLTITTSNPWELLEFGKKYLEQKCQPLIEDDIDVVDLFKSEDYRTDWKKISIGDTITLKYSNFNINDYNVKIINYTHDESSNSLKIKISNRDAVEDEGSFIIKTLNELRRSSTTLNTERTLYKYYLNDKDKLNNFVDSSYIDASNKEIIMNSNKIDEFGIESVGDEEYKLIYTKNKIIMVNEIDGTYYAALSPNGFCTSAINKDRIILDYNGLTMLNNENEKHGVCIDKSSNNKFADFALYYKDNKFYEIYNGITDICVNFHDKTLMAYNGINDMMHCYNKWNYRGADVGGLFWKGTYSTFQTMKDLGRFVDGQVIEITDHSFDLGENLPTNLSSVKAAYLNATNTKINMILDMLREMRVIE